MFTILMRLKLASPLVLFIYISEKLQREMLSCTFLLGKSKFLDTYTVQFIFLFEFHLFQQIFCYQTIMSTQLLCTSLIFQMKR